MAECAVCLADYVQPCRTPCGHVYCRDCLRATLKARPPWNRGACPLCRSAVSVYNTVDIQSGEALENLPDEDNAPLVVARWEQISVGFHHQCAVTEDAELKCWGPWTGPRIPSPSEVPPDFVVA